MIGSGDAERVLPAEAGCVRFFAAVRGLTRLLKNAEMGAPRGLESARRIKNE